MRDGPRGFRQDYSCPALLRIPLGLVCVHVRNCHPLRCSFPDASIPHTSAMARSYNPCDALLQRRFGLLPGRSPLLGESFLFSFPAGTKMFQFPALASSQQICNDDRQGLPGCPIRKSRDQRSFAPTPRLSQLIASFIASVSQGIRRAPFLSSRITQ